MARDIRPSEPEDIPEVSRFLVEGFQTPPDAEFAAPDVLHWKYFEPRDDRNVTRSFIAREEGRVIAHGGIFHGWFHHSTEPGRRVSTMHGIDWLSSPGHRTTGAFLMRRGHRLADTHYALNYSEAARRVIEAAGYHFAGSIPVMQKVLRPGYRLRGPGRPGPRDVARAARDVGRKLLRRGRRPSVGLELVRVDSFGPEVVPILEGGALDVVFSSRHPGWLNHALRYPRADISGHLIRRGGRLIGFGMLNVVRRAGHRLGKVVECFLDAAEPELWHAALAGLTAELAARGADLAETFASTPWMVQALRDNGFFEAHRVNFLLDDPGGLLPRDATFHLTPFEADYAYT